MNRKTTDGFAELPGTTVSRNRRCGGVHEDRQDRNGSEIAKYRFPHLDEPVIDRHSVRHCNVEVLRPHMIYKRQSCLFRNVQWTRPPSPVAERDRSRTDAERGHQVVEEAVEVIGRELDDIIGREFLHEGSEPPERRSNALLGFVAGRSSVHHGVWDAQTMATDMVGFLRTLCDGCRSIARGYFLTRGHWLSESGRLTASPGNVCKTL
jgi:hypothetical protein